MSIPLNLARTLSSCPPSCCIASRLGKVVTPLKREPLGVPSKVKTIRIVGSSSFGRPSSCAKPSSTSNRRPGSTDVSFDRVSPKLGATWELAPNANLFASYREAFRAPAESQLFRQGAAESTVDLKPVRAQSWEAGFRTALGGEFTRGHFARAV